MFVSRTASKFNSWEPVVQLLKALKVETAASVPRKSLQIKTCGVRFYGGGDSFQQTGLAANKDVKL